MAWPKPRPPPIYLYELPIPKTSAKDKTQLSGFAEKLLKNPRDVKERVVLEVFIARELYGLSLEDWKHLTGTFTFGSDSAPKEELDEIIRQSLAFWEDFLACRRIRDDSLSRNRRHTRRFLRRTQAALGWSGPAPG
jgi:hypothetical protein